MDESRPTVHSSYELTEQLERAAKGIDGVRREQFVDERSLCGSCRWARITRRRSQNNRVVYCGQITEIVPEDIVECSDYRSHTSLSLEQMAGLATLIDPRDHLRNGYR